jgi:hypothetical protein
MKKIMLVLVLIVFTSILSADLSVDKFHINEYDYLCASLYYYEDDTKEGWNTYLMYFTMINNYISRLNGLRYSSSSKKVDDKKEALLANDMWFDLYERTFTVIQQTPKGSVQQEFLFPSEEAFLRLGEEFMDTWDEYVDRDIKRGLLKEEQ